jgi:TPR repeat protein
MNGPDHYREAERLLDEATSRGDSDPAARWCLELAKVHTALADVAATALTRDGREWLEVAGRRLGNTSPALPEQARARICWGRRAHPASLSVL